MQKFSQQHVNMHQNGFHNHISGHTDLIDRRAQKINTKQERPPPMLENQNQIPYNNSNRIPPPKSEILNAQIQKNHIAQAQKAMIDSANQYRYNCNFVPKQRVLARCSEGTAFRGHVLELKLQAQPTPTLSVKFDDNDEVDVRIPDIRPILNETVPGTLKLVENFVKTPSFPVKCSKMGCRNVIMDPVLPKKTTGEDDLCSTVTCYLCGWSWHKRCYLSEYKFFDYSKTKASSIIQDTSTHYLAFKCRFCLIHIFTETRSADMAKYMSEGRPKNSDNRFLYSMNHPKAFAHFKNSKYNTIPDILQEEYDYVLQKLTYNPEMLNWYNSSHRSVHVNGSLTSANSQNSIVSSSLNSIAERRKENEQEKYCYCGATGDWYLKMIQCEKCLNWFHINCLTDILKDSLLNYYATGNLYFILFCRMCRPTLPEKELKGQGELLLRMGMTLNEAVMLTFYQLQEGDGDNRGNFRNFEEELWRSIETALRWLPVRMKGIKKGDLKNVVLRHFRVDTNICLKQKNCKQKYIYSTPPFI